MLSFNSPLRVGQLLEPRAGGAKWRITDFLLGPAGLLWFVAPVAGGDASRLTLSDVYAAFKFEA